jgi:hypothetical protein
MDEFLSTAALVTLGIGGAIALVAWVAVIVGVCIALGVVVNVWSQR